MPSLRNGQKACWARPRACTASLSFRITRRSRHRASSFMTSPFSSALVLASRRSPEDVVVQYEELWWRTMAWNFSVAPQSFLCVIPLISTKLWKLMIALLSSVWYSFQHSWLGDSIRFFPHHTSIWCKEVSKLSDMGGRGRSHMLPGGCCQRPSDRVLSL